MLNWGHMLPRVFGYSPPQVPGAHLLAPLFGTIVFFFYGGWPFVQGAVRELRDRLPGMMTLIALAITVAFFFSAAVTPGYPGMVASRATDGLHPDEVLRVAAAVEQDAEHPVARAIVSSAAERRLSVPRARDFEAIPGHGAQASVDGRGMAVGGPNLLRRDGVTVPAELEAFAREAADRRQGVVYLVEQGRTLAAFAVADAVRPESAEAVRLLHAQGIEVVMLTGDARPVAEAVGRELGIGTVFAEVLPQDKVRKGASGPGQARGDGGRRGQ